MKFAIARVIPGNEGKEATKWARELDELLWRWVKSNKGEHLRLSQGLAVVGLEDLEPLKALAGIYGCTDRGSAEVVTSFAKLWVSQDVTELRDADPRGSSCRWPSSGWRWISLSEARCVP